MLSWSLSTARDFSTKVLLGKHHTNNPYGEWKIVKKRATDKKYKAEITVTKSWGETYNILKGTDIEIINIPYYKIFFIGKSYYKFYWNKKKNKGYFDENAEKINATISAIPMVKLRVKNLSKKALKLVRIESKNIFQSGGMADYNARALVPKVKKGAMELSYNKTDTMTFPKEYVIASGKVIDLPLSLWVKNATHGDGSGHLVYALEIDYIKDGKRKTEVLTIIEQADAEGYEVGAIKPLN